MAKAATAGKPANKDPKARKSTPRVYKLLKKIPEEGIPPQMRTILEAIGDPGSEITRDKLLSKLETKLKGAQEPGKVLSFYRKRMIDEKLVAEKKEAA